MIFFYFISNLGGVVCSCYSFSPFPGYFDERKNTVSQSSVFLLHNSQHFSKCEYCILKE